MRAPRTILLCSAAVLPLSQACSSATPPANMGASGDGGSSESSGASGSSSGLGGSTREGGSSGAASGPSGSQAGGGSSNGDASTSGSLSSSSGALADAASEAGSAGSDEGGTGTGIGAAAAAIHDDFESGSLSSTWSLWNQYGVPNAQYTPVTTVAVDTTHAHGGTHAVKITGGGSGGGFFGAPPPAQSFFGRAWVYLGASPGMEHWAMAVGLGPGAQPQLQVRIGGNLGVYDSNIANPGDSEIRASLAPPIGQWMCIEFYYATQSLQYWQDGHSILDINPTTMWGNSQPPSPWTASYADIAFGFAGENGTPVDTWIDDVAVDTKRIGCN